MCTHPREYPSMNPSRCSSTHFLCEVLIYPSRSPTYTHLRGHRSTIESRRVFHHTEFCVSCMWLLPLVFTSIHNYTHPRVWASVQCPWSQSGVPEHVVCVRSACLACIQPWCHYPALSISCMVGLESWHNYVWDFLELCVMIMYLYLVIIHSSTLADRRTCMCILDWMLIIILSRN